MDHRKVWVNTFDDGHQNKASLPNEWRVIGTLFGGDKLVLENVVTGDRINSISAWKTSPL